MRAARKYARKRPNQYARLFMILISIKRYRHLRARAGRNILVVVVALAAHAALRACRTSWLGDAHAASELTRARDGARPRPPPGWPEHGSYAARDRDPEAIALAR
jgi:hypothetical protein